MDELGEWNNESGERKDCLDLVWMSREKGRMRKEKDNYICP